MNEQKKLDLEKATTELKKLPKNGPYSHNIASMILREIMTKYDIESANSLVKKCRLQSKFGIYPINK